MDHRLPEAVVREFQMIAWDEFQMDLSYPEAEQRALEVLEFFQCLFEEKEPEEGQKDMPPPATPSVSSTKQGQLF